MLFAEGHSLFAKHHCAHGLTLSLTNFAVITALAMLCGSNRCGLLLQVLVALLAVFLLLLQKICSQMSP